MWPFARKPVVEPEMAEWMLDHADWLLTAHSRASAFAAAQLLPISDKVFPTNGLEGQALAEHLLEKVLGYMSMSSLDIALVADDRNARFRNETGNAYHVQPKSGAAGTYRRGERIEITYDIDLLRRPADLVAVLAHEAAHAVLDLGAAVPPPSDPDFDELLTDFTKVLLGFGLFHIAHRKPINAWSVEIANEWRNLYAFYMNRREGCFATALFCDLHGIEPALALRACEPDARGTLKQAFADLTAHRARLGALRETLARARGEARSVPDP